MSPYEYTCRELERRLAAGISLLEQVGSRVPPKVQTLVAVARASEARPEKGERYWLTRCTLAGAALNEVIAALPDEPRREMLS